MPDTKKSNDCQKFMYYKTEAGSALGGSFWCIGFWPWNLSILEVSQFSEAAPYSGRVASSLALRIGLLGINVEPGGPGPRTVTATSDGMGP